MYRFKYIPVRNCNTFYKYIYLCIDLNIYMLGTVIQFTNLYIYMYRFKYIPVRNCNTIYKSIYICIDLNIYLLGTGG